MKKILFVIALYKEAKPLIDAFDLKSTETFSSFQIFSSDEAELIISGTGKIASAAATTCVLMRNKNPRVIFNIGIAAKREGNIGDLFLIDQIIDNDTGRKYFSDIFSTPESLGLRSQLRTVSSPCTDYAFDELIDMEASGFFEAASHFLSADKIQVLKVISDVLQKGSIHLNPEAIQQLIQKHIPSIQSFVSLFQPEGHKEIFSQEDEVSIQSFISKYYFTLTQERQLFSLLRKLCIQLEISITEILSSLHIHDLEGKNRKQITKEILKELEERLK